MHKAFPLLEESSHWQYKFPLPVEGVPTARRMEIPLPGRLHWYQKSRRNSLAQVESRLVEYKEREVKYYEKIKTLEFHNESNNECIEILKKKLETLKEEKEGVDGKLAGLLKASKDLDNLIESQRSDKIKNGLGYSAVPPPPAQLYLSSMKDLSWTGLPECADDTITDYSRPSPTVETSKDLDNLIESQRSDKIKNGLGYSAVPPPLAQLYLSPMKDLSWTGLPECADDTITDYRDYQNRNSSASENGESTDSILSKLAVKFLKAAERPTTDKVETEKKPAVRYAELYRKPSEKSNVRGNQRNWNNLKSQQLGNNFVMKKKACYNCGHFDHLSYDCGLGVKMGRSSPKNNYTHMSMPPRSAIHRPYRPPIRTTRANTNAATRPYVNSARPHTTQEWMIILIQRVQRLERELKERALVHNVDRGKSRPVMAWVPKKV
nr:ubiquitin hydrolase [Tanacetum cinerariifolium]